MATQLIIGNFNQGLTTARKPFVIDNDAFPTLFNAYQWRGQIKKKRGTDLLGRLRRDLTNQALGNTGGGGAFSGNIISILTLQSTSGIVPGSVTITVGAQSFTEPATPDGTLTNGAGGTGTINYATGAITLQTAPVLAATAVTIAFGYYPNLPVLGLEDFLDPGDPPYPKLVAFDTVYAYQFNQSSNIFYDVSFYKVTKAPLVWSGTDYQQFWSTNYANALWVTNGKPGFHFKNISGITNANPGQVTIANHGLSNGDRVWLNEVGGMTQVNGQTYTVTVTGANTFTIGVDTSAFGGYTSGGIAQYLTRSVSGQGDGIRWYDGDPNPASGLGWVNFSPPLNNLAQPEYLTGAIAVLPFKDRLLFFSPTTQTSTGTTRTYIDQVIYSQVGTPYYNALVPNSWPASSFEVEAWYQNVGGRGGFISAGIDQQMTTITNNEDVLLIGFTGRQTKLVYSGNDFFPFQFFSINSELGAISTFSSVTLDKGGITIGPYGITISNQYSTERIDLQIPDQVFDIRQASNGAKRVNTARDYRNEWIYFSYPSNQSFWDFPTQTLLYNYRDQSWAILGENYTTHGSYRRTSSYTWATIGTKFPTWNDWTEPWNSGSTAAQYPNVIAGNQQGFVEILSNGTSEDFSGHISAITVSGGTVTITSPDHCLSEDDYIYVDNCIGTIGSTINGSVHQVRGITQSDPDTFQIDDTSGIAGTYLGAGRFIRLIRPFFQTKQFPTFWGNARKVRIGSQRYLFDKTQEGEVEVNIYLSQDPSNAYNVPPLYPDPDRSNSSLIYTDVVFTHPEHEITTCNDLPLGSLGNGVATTLTINLFQTFKFEDDIVPGSVEFTIGTVATFTDDGEGGFTVTGTGVALGSSIDYTQGIAILVFSSAPNAQASEVSLQYEIPTIQSPTGAAQNQIWHRMSTSLIGDTIQLGFTLSDEQMRDDTLQTQFSEVVLHAIVMDLFPGPILI
jgi:hypothetical protein